MQGARLLFFSVSVVRVHSTGLTAIIPCGMVDLQPAPPIHQGDGQLHAQEACSPSLAIQWCALVWHEGARPLYMVVQIGSEPPQWLI